MPGIWCHLGKEFFFTLQSKMFSQTRQNAAEIFFPPEVDFSVLQFDFICQSI